MLTMQQIVSFGINAEDTSDANSDENAAVPGSFKERTAHDFK